MENYIWQHSNWPNFNWDVNTITPYLQNARQTQQQLLSAVGSINLNNLGEILASEVIETSSIEGEVLDPNDVRSSVAKRLGLTRAGLPAPSRHTEGIVEMLMEATTNFRSPLTKNRLFEWHKLLFLNARNNISNEEIGKYRISKNPMRVISGRMGSEVIHYEAPPSAQVNKEVQKFLNWFSSEESLSLDGYIRAAIAHFWFVTIHPFEDGNGRISRCITDMAIAQDEQSQNRYYSLSSQIRLDRKKYYEILEETQRGDGDLTNWLIWFLETITKSINTSLSNINKSLSISKFYDVINNISLNERQLKVMRKLLENLPDDFQGGLTNKKYVAMAKTSPESAKRDLKDLLEKGLILKNDGAGRSTSYRLNREIIK
ncbi:Fic family protein [Halobacteriovorax sp. HFRX-2_2]|uniref:Fic family protein n=1 Tax=unclassified Halobacteriovorax TaxID=2639665 RepID=UPI00371A4C39